jgi:hypothetical protein
MRKTILSVATLVLLFFASCSDESNLIPANSDELKLKQVNEVFASNQRNCQAMEVLEMQLQNDPKLAARMTEIEQFTYQFEKGMANKGKPGSGGEEPTPYNGVVTIPVIVHVLYNTTQENISDAQIASQIAVLNEDFRKTNSDYPLTPSEFSNLVTDSEVQFVLVKTNRKSTTKTSWGTNNSMKYTSQGGIDAENPSKNLNIWVCNIGGGILGYAQFPGGSAATDGVVIGPNYFGRVGYLSVPFNKGRTATHEVGHWLNLRHIWGDGRCQADDYVVDTPSSDAPNYGCPNYPTVNCNSNDMTMNYMDYTDDSCMFMFTTGQKTRMRALFAAGGVRQSFVLP